MTKRCSRCDSVKSVDEFYRDKQACDGLQSRCKDCCKAHSKQWFQENPPDPVRRRAIVRAFHERNPDKEAEYGAQYRQKVSAREGAGLRAKRWREENRESRVASQHNRRARTKGITTDDVDYIAVLRSDPCSYCGSYGKTVDHIEPLNHGGSCHWNNLTAACRSCNAAKQTKDVLTFLRTRAV